MESTEPDATAKAVPATDPEPAEKPAETLSQEEEKVSKRELKRRRKEAEWKQKKEQLKKAKDKEKINKSKQKRARHAFAAADGATKEVVDEETGQIVEKKVNRKERKELWKQMIKTCMKVVIDCDFAECMSDKELNSLSKQIMYCHSENKKAIKPVNLILTG